MTQNLRWYPIEAIGSFVSVTPAGSLIVAPMYADGGKRSTYEGEICEIEEESNVAEITRWVAVGNLSDSLRSILRNRLTVAELVEVDARQAAVPSFCAMRDFYDDASDAMAEAFKISVGRPANLESDFDSKLWEDAWALARVEGYAPLFVDADATGLLALAAEALETSASKASNDLARGLRLLSDRLRANVAPAPYVAKA